MSTTPFSLSIVTPAKTVYEGHATSVTLPGADGYVGIWAHHAPMVVGMRPGVLRFNDVENQAVEKTYAIGSGFSEVSDNKVIVLADFAEADGEIDVDRARAALERAKKRLLESVKNQEIDPERAKDAISRAEARLKAAYERGK